jgi:hypothetical protein
MLNDKIFTIWHRISAFLGSRNGLIVALIIGVVIRLVLVTGHNYDKNSYLIVAKIIEHGGNVYAETFRYNYGPVWFNIVYGLYRLSTWFTGTYNEVTFYYCLTIFLTIVDIAIFLILRRYYGAVIACLFFFNPVSIVITGFHAQF